MEVVIKPFAALSVDALYEILALRSRVFVVEQHSVYHDPDGLDPHCLHVMLREGRMLAGYTRILPPGLKFPEAAFGRLVVAPEARGSGLGRRLVHEALAGIAAQLGGGPVIIEAQAYLADFYASEGFVAQGEPFDMDGISHITMRRG